MAAWIVRAGRNGIYADEWLKNGYVAIFWDFDGADINALDKDELKSRFAQKNPDATPQSIAANAGMVYRFAREMNDGETVVMYDPATRLYHLGLITGPCQYFPPNDEEDGSYRRKVKWIAEAARDSLTAASKNALGGISTLFAVSDDTMKDLERASKTETPTIMEEDASASEARDATVEDGIERIKDIVSRISWEDMELLVAGVLRSMGYKTSMTRKGSDGGRDIIASPDGLGLESPRIIVEVKHRKASMGAPAIRSFIGGLRSTDSGLYVSTGGFTKDAFYEADRAPMPVKLLDLDQFVRLLVDNYDAADMEMRTILPLVRIYWPA